MPKKRIAMKKFRDIIRIAQTKELSQRQIAQALRVSRPQVNDTLAKLKQSGKTYEEIKHLSDSQLHDLLTHAKPVSNKAEELAAQFPYVAKELKRPGVTRQLLWEEYLEKHPDGLRYTQFCYHFQQWQKDADVSMHIDHKAGDKMFVDYAGKKLELTDPKTGKKTPVDVFVAILPASQLTYAEAALDQTQESFVRSNEEALVYFGGVPAAIVPDNLKAGVLKANIYEPDLNPLFADFAEFYRTAVLPARARKPKDKAHVENAVKLVYQRVYAPLRNRTFHTLEELNQAIKERLEVHNNRKLTKMTVSRRELFEEIERQELKALPTTRYPLKYIQNNTLVEFNYHVKLKEDSHYYSVPSDLKGKRVKIIYDDRSVAIYYDNIRIWQHKRNRNSHKYTTEAVHMPKHHRFKEDWNPEKLIWWAGNIGDETKQAISHILSTKPHPEQAYKSCMGILNQAPKYGNTILNLACRRALNLERINFPTIEKEVKLIKQQYEQDQEKQQLSLLPEIHENVRGHKNYQ